MKLKIELADATAALQKVAAAVRALGEALTAVLRTVIFALKSLGDGVRLNRGLRISKRARHRNPRLRAPYRQALC